MSQVKLKGNKRTILRSDNMNTRELELSLKQKGIDVRILYCEDICGEYWIVYTNDMTYMPATPLKTRQYLVEKEKDIIAIDVEDAITQISEKEKV